MPYNSCVQVPVTIPAKPTTKVRLPNDLHGAMVKRRFQGQHRWRWQCPRRCFHCGVRSPNRTWWRQRVRSRNVKPWVKVTWMMVKYQIDQRLSRSFKRPGEGGKGNFPKTLAGQSQGSSDTIEDGSWMTAKSQIMTMICHVWQCDMSSVDY